MAKSKPSPKKMPMDEEQGKMPMKKKMPKKMPPIGKKNCK